MLCDCGPGRKLWQPATGFMTITHLQADCLDTGINSRPNAYTENGNNITF